MEKCIKDRPVLFLNNNNNKFLNNTQNYPQNKIFTADAIADVIEFMNNSIGDGDKCEGISLDWEKAFEAVGERGY